MGTVEIIALLVSLADASTKLMINFSQVSELFSKMAAEGRDKLTPDEEAHMVMVRDQARAGLQAGDRRRRVDGMRNDSRRDRQDREQHLKVALEVSLGEHLQHLLQHFLLDNRPKGYGQLTLRGNQCTAIRAIRMSFPIDTTLITGTLEYVDAKGRPARVDGIPVWTFGGDAVGEGVVSDDGMSVAFTPNGETGIATVSVEADADLGSGVKSLITTGAIELTPAEAAGGSITFTAS